LTIYRDFAATHPLLFTVVTLVHGGSTTPPLTLADYQVTWTEFRITFRAHYIPTDVMRK
jgi:hypothetical protein